jgi:hypothetical protein
MMATYKVQIDDVVRDATPAEVAQIEAQHAEAQVRSRSSWKRKPLPVKHYLIVLV